MELLRDKLYCMVYNLILNKFTYVFLVPLFVVFLNVIGGVDIRDIFLTVIIEVIICFYTRKILIIKEKPLIVIVCKKHLLITMYGSLKNMSDIGVIRAFKNSFTKIINKHELLAKTGKKEIYINTHESFTRGILQMLTGENLRRCDFEKIVSDGYKDIQGYKVNVSIIGYRKNKMLAARYPLWLSKENINKYLRENQEQLFYETRFSVELFAMITKE